MAVTTTAGLLAILMDLRREAEAADMVGGMPRDVREDIAARAARRFYEWADCAETSEIVRTVESLVLGGLHSQAPVSREVKRGSSRSDQGRRGR